MGLTGKDLEDLKSLGGRYFSNLAAVAARHTYRDALGLPVTAEEFDGRFPEKAREMVGELRAGKAKRFFQDADAAYTSSSTSYHFRTLNGMLRTGRAPTGNPEGYRTVAVLLMMEMDLLAGTETLYRAVDSRAVPELAGLWAWAGDRPGPFDLSRYTKSRSFRDLGVVSTSREEGGAGHMMIGEKEKVLLVITPTAGCRGFCPVSRYRSEHELALAPMTRFTINSLDRGAVRKCGAGRLRVGVTASFGG